MLGGVASLAGCAGGDQSGSGNNPDQAAKASAGGTIEAGWAIDEVELLDPHYVDLWHQITIFSNVFSGIVKVNAKGEIVGDLASDWTLPDDQTYEFTIREGVTFHNGDTLDAGAIKWSIERLMGLDDSPHVGKVASVESVEAPDPTTLRINLEQPTAPFITFLTRGPGRAGTVVNKTAVEKDPERYKRYPVGSGPFKVEKRETGEFLQLVKFEEYWERDDEGNALPYLDEIRINLIPEPSTMWTALKTDEIQYTDEVPPQNARLSKKLDSITVTGTAAGEWSAIALLCNDPASEEWKDKQALASGNEEPTDYWTGKEIPTTDRRVRQAIAKAIDRKDLVKKAYFGYATPAHSLFNPAMGIYYQEKPENAQVHDPEGAKKLLDEAGYTGKPRFTARLLGTPADKRMMTVVKQHLSEVGIEIELDVQQESSYWDNIYLYNHMTAVYGGGGDIDPWMSWWKQLKTPEEDSSAGAWQKNLFSNAEFDKLLEQSFVTPKPEERLKIVRQAEQIFLKEAPFAMTTFPLTPKGGSTKLRDVGNQIGLSNFHRAYVER